MMMMMMMIDLFYFQEMIVEDENELSSQELAGQKQKRFRERPKSGPIR